VYKTKNYGKTWTSIKTGIPKSVLSYTRFIREDPVRKGLLYLGTENALYVSLNDGTAWLPLQINLPHAPVHSIVVQEHFNDLVIATHGRGFWILDDITPLQQLTPEVSRSDIFFFPPRPAYRFHPVTPPRIQRGDPCIGENPPYGASINYYLKTDQSAQVKISILDENGQTIRTLDGSKDRGINRVWWDLKYDLSKEPKLRTSPLYAPWVKPGSQGWRPLRPSSGGGRMTFLAPPGNYTVKLAVGEETLSQELIVKKDPHSTGSEEDIQLQTKMLLEIRDNLETVVDMINQLEWMRRQIYDLEARLIDIKGTDTVISEAKTFDKKIISLEENLFLMPVTGTGQDYWYYKGPSKLVTKLLSFATSVSRADFPPTTQHTERHELFKEQIETYQDQFDELITKDLPAFNGLLSEKNLPQIMHIKKP
jgi:hypothetical protein